MANSMKKDLQKIVKKYRDSKPSIKNWRGESCRDEFPKAMMTGQQEANRTATINFGYNNERHHTEYAEFANSEALRIFCENHGVRVVGKEINQDNRVQMRLSY